MQMQDDNVRQVLVSDKKSLREFVRLERELVGSNPMFVSAIDSDVSKQLAGNSEFFSAMEHTLFVASSEGWDQARCAALINRRYQEDKGEDVGFIGYFAAAPDAEPQVAAMFEQAEAWLRERGVSRIIAPFNGAAALGVATLAAAFDEEPMFPFGWQPPYYAEYFQNTGYNPTYPFWYYTVDFASEKYRSAAEKALENQSVVIRPINKKNWDEDMEAFRQVFVETFKEEWEFHPYTSEEFREFFDPMKPVIDTRQMLLAEVEGKVAGFCFGLPDWTPMFRSFKGKMGPLQIIRLLFGAGRYSRAGLLGIGVLPEFRGTGVAQSLAITLYKRYEEKGLKEAFYYPVNESNTPSRRFAESLGGSGRVMYHCYDKQLN